MQCLFEIWTPKRQQQATNMEYQTHSSKTRHWYVEYTSTNAILGCNTTSRIFGLGKGMALKQMACDSFAAAIEVLNKLPSAVTKQDIIRAGEEAIIAMYNGKSTLDSLTYQTFCKKYW